MPGRHSTQRPLALRKGLEGPFSRTEESDRAQGLCVLTTSGLESTAVMGKARESQDHNPRADGFNGRTTGVTASSLAVGVPLRDEAQARADGFNRRTTGVIGESVTASGLAAAGCPSGSGRPQRPDLTTQAIYPSAQQRDI